MKNRLNYNWIFYFVFFIFLGFFVVGCQAGNDDDDDDVVTEPDTGIVTETATETAAAEIELVKGIVAKGLAVSLAQITILDSSIPPKEIDGGKTAVNGSYSVKVSEDLELIFPIQILVTPPSGKSLKSVVPTKDPEYKVIIANINPITTVATEKAIENADGQLANIDDELFSAVGTEVVEKVLGAGVSFSAFSSDDFGSARTDEGGGSTVDAILDTLSEQDGGDIFQTVENRFNENKPALEEPAFNLELVANLATNNKQDAETTKSTLSALVKNEEVKSFLDNVTDMVNEIIVEGGDELDETKQKAAINMVTASLKKVVKEDAIKNPKSLETLKKVNTSIKTSSIALVKTLDEEVLGKESKLAALNETVAIQVAFTKSLISDDAVDYTALSSTVTKVGTSTSEKLADKEIDNTDKIVSAIGENQENIAQIVFETVSQEIAPEDLEEGIEITEDGQIKKDGEIIDIPSADIEKVIPTETETEVSDTETETTGTETEITSTEVETDQETDDDIDTGPAIDTGTGGGNDTGTGGGDTGTDTEEEITTKPVIQIDRVGSTNKYDLNIIPSQDVSDLKLVSYSGVAIECKNYSLVSNETPTDFVSGNLVILSDNFIDELDEIQTGARTVATISCSDPANFSDYPFRNETSLTYEGNISFHNNQISSKDYRNIKGTTPKILLRSSGIDDLYKLTVIPPENIANTKRLISFGGIGITCEGYTDSGELTDFEITAFDSQDIVILHGNRIASSDADISGPVDVVSFDCSSPPSFAQDSLPDEAYLTYDGNLKYENAQISTQISIVGD